MNIHDKYCIGGYLEWIFQRGLSLREDEERLCNRLYDIIWSRFCEDHRIRIIRDINLDDVVHIVQKQAGFPLAIEQLQPEEGTRIKTQNGVWYFTKVEDGFTFAPVSNFSFSEHIINNRRVYIQLTADSIADIIKEFDLFIPVIQLAVRKHCLEIERDRLYKDVILTTAKGIVDNLIKKGEIRLKRHLVITHITGESVYLNFQKGKQHNFGCKFKFLERELLERFGRR